MGVTHTTAIGPAEGEWRLPIAHQLSAEVRSFFMKTRAQKIETAKGVTEKLKSANTVVLTDFTGLTANGMNVLRKSLREVGMQFQVIKKRILKRVFGETGITLNPKEIEGQLGVVFSPKDIVGTAQPIYAFQKANKDIFRITGGVLMEEKKILTGETVAKIGGLPGREVLIAQIIGMFAAPIRSFLFVVNEKAKKGV